MTKREAIIEVVTNGYTIHFNTGESGDCGIGSRMYYCKPNAARNASGYPLQTAEISKVPGVPGGWLTSYFGE